MRNSILNTTNVFVSIFVSFLNSKSIPIDTDADISNKTYYIDAGIVEMLTQ